MGKLQRGLRFTWILAGALLAVLGVAGLLLGARAASDWRVAAAVLGLAILLLIVAGRLRRWVPRRTILEVDFERGVVERAAPSMPFSGGASRGPLALRDVLAALERAAVDKRVVGLVARVGAFRPGLAVAQELRDAVLAFRAHGKPAIAWAETLGEGTSATVECFFASAFETLHVHPVGDVGFDGAMLQQPFLAGALEKLGVKPQLDHRREYKSAKYMFTEHGFTDAHRESSQSLLDSQMDQIVEGIAEARGLEVEKVRALLDAGPFFGADAVESGLVDGLAYRDEVVAKAKETLRGKLLYLDRYLRRVGRPHRKGTGVALIHAVGGIARGASRPGSAWRSATIGSDDLSAALRKAVRKKRIKAILLRVDSPGGSAVASDAVWREMGRARDAGKPVVVTMGNVAASGGYYIAVGADRILAQPGTITGSIGVVWGKFVTRDAWAKLGVEFDAVRVGEHADLWSSGYEFTEAGWQKMQAALDRIYEEFKDRVATGRGFDAETVEAVAKGRVWTGRQALERRLVDALGGWKEALGACRELLDLGPDAPLCLKPLYPPRSRFGRPRAEESSEAAAALAPVVRRLGELGLLEPEGPLTLPYGARANFHHFP